MGADLAEMGQGPDAVGVQPVLAGIYGEHREPEVVYAYGDINPAFAELGITSTDFDRMTKAEQAFLTGLSVGDAIGSVLGEREERSIDSASALDTVFIGNDIVENTPLSEPFANKVVRALYSGHGEAPLSYEKNNNTPHFVLPE